MTESRQEAIRKYNKMSLRKKFELMVFLGVWNKQNTVGQCENACWDYLEDIK